MSESATDLIGIKDRRLPEHGLQAPHTADDVLDLQDASNDDGSDRVRLYLDFAHHCLAVLGFL